MKFAIMVALGIGPNASAHTVPDDLPRTESAEFTITNVEYKVAVCTEFNSDQTVKESKSVKPPGCVLHLKTREELKAATHRRLNEAEAFAREPLCNRKVGDVVKLDLRLSMCLRPFSLRSVGGQPKYCDISEFDHPERITNAHWACLIGGLWEVAHVYESPKR